jgi:outer membrane protein
MKPFIFFLAIFFTVFANAQQQLTLQDAIDTALKNNFDIQIAKNKAEIGKIKNNYGNAGGLPIVSANAGDNGYIHHTNQEFSDGSQTSQDNARGNTIDAGVSANMYLFNGFKIIATKERLNSLQKQSELLLNQQVQNTIADIMIKYYDIVRQQNYTRIIQNTLDFSSKKMEIVNKRSSVGMANSADILQAQMDLNNAMQSLKLQQTLVEQDKTDLYLLMGLKQFTPFNIADSIIIDNSLLLDSITNFLDKNPLYLSAEQQININEQIMKEISSQRYPSVKINAGYDYVHSDYSSGSTRMNQYYGPSAGISIQIPIFNGNLTRTQKKSAQFDLENANLQKESLFNSLKANAIKIYQSYSTSLNQIETQQTNYELASKLMEVVLKNFQMNQATILDVKTAQTTFENAAYLLINLQYSAKVAEIELKQLTYSLVY